MSKVADFLTKIEQAAIIEAIQLAEQNTSGEIRVHLEEKSEKDAYTRALEVFNDLKMYETNLRNGVLIYVAIDDKKFAICGDEGINAIVAADFWDCTKNIMVAHFTEQNFKQGLIEGIIAAGNQLKKYFPAQQNDKDELSNEISFS